LSISFLEDAPLFISGVGIGIVLFPPVLIQFLVNSIPYTSNFSWPKPVMLLPGPDSDIDPDPDLSISSVIRVSLAMVQLNKCL